MHVYKRFPLEVQSLLLMVFRRTRRRNGRRRKRRRKMSLGRRVKTIVKKQFKKRIEMKFAEDDQAAISMNAGGLLTEFFTAAEIQRGVADDERVGDRINLHRWMIRGIISGPAGPNTELALYCRVIIATSKRAAAASDFPTSVVSHVNADAMKKAGLFFVSDRVYYLAPASSTNVTTADTYSRWAGSAPMTRYINKKIRLRGRERRYLNDASIEIGHLYIYSISETAGGDFCNQLFETRLYYTDG